MEQPFFLGHMLIISSNAWKTVEPWSHAIRSIIKRGLERLVTVRGTRPILKLIVCFSAITESTTGTPPSKHPASILHVVSAVLERVRRIAAVVR